MASTFSTSLQIQLIGSGEQSGIWGTSTNTNWNLIEQAVAGVQSITMTNANYTLSVANGASDEARNMVLFVGGSNSAIRQIIAPLVPKIYVVYNNTSGGYAITIGGSSGALATIPTGSSTLVFCDGSNFYAGISAAAGNFSIAGNETVSGNASITGNTTVGGNLAVTGTTTLTGDATAPTQISTDNSTKIATTAFVQSKVGTLGTMATQNANAVAITGGAINGTTVGATTPSTGSFTSFTANATPTIGETTTVVASPSTGTINFDIKTQSILYYTSTATANWTLNFRGDGSTSLNTLMAVGETRTVTYIAAQSASGYYANAIQIDGSSVTPKWQGGTAPTLGGVTGLGIYTFAIIKTASATFTVLASITTFA